MLYSPTPTPKGILLQEPNVPSHLYSAPKSGRATSKETKTKQRPRKELERRKKEKKKEKRERKERERHLEIFRTISILYGAFCLKKNEKGMMEKGRESDKFNDVCSKLRLEK